MRTYLTIYQPVTRALLAGNFPEFFPPNPRCTATAGKVQAALPSRYGVEIEFSLLALDSEREASMRLFTGGLSFPRDGKPYASAGDSALQRYVVAGDVCVIPDDYCPHCWGAWDFKLRNPACPECGYSLGKEVKFLIDSDVCPYCGRGTVTIKSPKCPECDFVAEPNLVVWG